MTEAIKDVHNWLRDAGYGFGDKEKITLAIRLLREEVDELEIAFNENDKEEMADAIADIFFVLHNASFFAGFSPEQVEQFHDTILKSNQSKFVYNLVDVLKTKEKYKEKGIDVIAEKVRPGCWVLRRNDGKLLKGINFVEPKHF